PIQAELSHKYPVNEIGRRLSRSPDSVFRRLARNERGREKQSVSRGLPGQFFALRICNDPGPTLTSEPGVGHSDKLVGTRVKAGRFLDADQPTRGQSMQDRSVKDQNPQKQAPGHIEQFLTAMEPKRL